MLHETSIAALRSRAAALRQSSIDWITTDSAKARRLLELAEKLEERALLLTAAGRVGAPPTYNPFRRHFLAGGER